MIFTGAFLLSKKGDWGLLILAVCNRGMLFKKTLQLLSSTCRSYGTDERGLFFLPTCRRPHWRQSSFEEKRLGSTNSKNSNSWWTNECNTDASGGQIKMSVLSLI